MILFAIGDVVDKAGCDFLRQKLPAFKKFKGVDICVANGENSAAGNGITPESAQHLINSGVDVITTGNHVYRRKEIYDYLDENADIIIRPGNFHAGNPGVAYTIVDKGRYRAAFINISGNAFMDNAENAFTCINKLLEATKDIKIRVVDFHAETTGEKRAMGFYLDGKVSVLYGTHTHVQTADEQILPESTGYITDLGMSGPIQSVLGVKPEIIIKKLSTGMPVLFSAATGACRIEGCLFEIDEKTGKCISVERVRLE